MSFLSRLFGADDARLDAATFARDRDPKAPVLDARTPAEFAQGHLRGAHNLNVLAPDFARRAQALGLPAEAPVYVYCRSGHRSSRAVTALRKMGHAGAVNVGSLGALQAVGAR